MLRSASCDWPVCSDQSQRAQRGRCRRARFKQHLHQKHVYSQRRRQKLAVGAAGGKGGSRGVSPWDMCKSFTRGGGVERWRCEATVRCMSKQQAYEIRRKFKTYVLSKCLIIPTLLRPRPCAVCSIYYFALFTASKTSPY